MTEPLVWSRERIAQALGCSTKTFDRHFRNKRGFPKPLPVGGAPRWVVSAVKKWIDQHKDDHVPEDSGQTAFWVYYAFDENRKPLYIGQTKHIRNRFGAHNRDSHWFPMVKSFAFKQCTDRLSAQNAEYFAIQKHKPEHNKHLTCLYKGNHDE